MKNQIRIGERLPSCQLSSLDSDGNVIFHDTAELFSDGLNIIFYVTGAFTPICSTRHVPGFESRAAEFRQLGFENLYCVAPNDPYTMRAWADQCGFMEVCMISDHNQDLARAMGEWVDWSYLALGWRPMRYSLILNRGIISNIFPEMEDNSGGECYGVSDASTVLKHIRSEI